MKRGKAINTPRLNAGASRTRGFARVRYITRAGTYAWAKVLETHPDRLYCCRGRLYFNVDPITKHLLSAGSQAGGKQDMGEAAIQAVKEDRQQSKLFDTATFPVEHRKRLGYPAHFSDDRNYRFTLWREWGYSPAKIFVQFVGLNPSTADETIDDNTVRRCINYAKAWNGHAMCMTNLWPIRSTDPAGIKASGGRDHEAENDRWLLEVAKQATLTVCCWGNHGAIDDRGSRVLKMLTDAGVRPMHFGLTGAGFPKHPLYLPKAAELEFYS